MTLSFDRVMRASISIRSRSAGWAALPLRLIVGYGFMAHGYAKLVRGPETFVGILQTLGVPAPEIAGWGTILVELAGGFAIMVGAFVPLASLPMSVILLVAMFTVHLPYGFSSVKLQAVTATGPQFGQPGFEVNLLYLACLATLVIAGPGPFAVDGLLARLEATRVRRGLASRSGRREPSGRGGPERPSRGQPE